MTIDPKSQKVVEMIQTFSPDYKLVSKTDSTFMSILGWLLGLFGAKTFTTSFWTTIGSTTYCPTDPAILQAQWVVLLHEGKHVVQQKTMGMPLYFFLYLFPLSLFPIFLFIGFFFWPVFILAFASLMPLPAPWRKKLEMEGYRTAMILSALNPNIQQDYNKMQSFFTGPDYYFMWPFGIQSDIDQAELDISDTTIYSDTYNKAVRDLIIAEGWTK